MEEQELRYIRPAVHVRVAPAPDGLFVEVEVLVIGSRRHRLGGYSGSPELPILHDEDVEKATINTTILIPEEVEPSPALGRAHSSSSRGIPSAPRPTGKASAPREVPLVPVPDKLGPKVFQGDAKVILAP